MMTNRTIKSVGCLVLSLLLSIVLLPVQANTAGEETLVNLKLSDGLSGETVNRVMTDHAGRVWIATTNGITAFNGKRLKPFILGDPDHDAITVYDLCETRDRSIYAATENGLYRMRLGESRFTKILPEVLAPDALLADGDTVYIGGRQGLQIYNGQTLTTRLIGASRKGLDNIVRHYVKAADGSIWFLGRFNLYRYDPKTDQTTEHTLEGLMPAEVPLTQFDIVGDKFYIGTRGAGVYVVDLQAHTARRIDGVGNIVMTVRKSADGYVCVATDGSGARLIDPTTDTVAETFSMEGEGLHRLPTNGLYCYYRDTNGVNWFGFVRYGLAYSYHEGTLFTPFTAGSFSAKGLNVRSFLRRGHDCLLGLQNGLYYVNDSSGIVRYFPPEALLGGHIVNNIAWHDGFYYVGTFDGGLTTFDPKSLTIRRTQLDPLFDNGSIGDIKTAPDGSLWIGCSHGLFIFRPDGTCERFTEQNSHIVGGIILSITFDQSGNAWLTGQEGISIYSAASHEIVDGGFPQGFFNKEPWLIGTSGHDGHIYMRNGLQTFYTDLQMTDFGELALPFRFADKWCRAFVDDLHGHYWIPSAKGLFRFDYDMGGMLHFGNGDGLQGDFINGIRLDGDSTLWVATSQGLYTMRLQQLDAWVSQERYKVQLFEIRRGSDLFSSAEEIMANETRRINLDWNLGSEALQMEPVLSDFAQQSGRLYEYRIDGGTWTIVADGGLISIRSLFMGRHRLEVRLAGVEGTMSVWEMRVIPSVWAIVELLMLTALLASLFFWNRYRMRSKSLLSERNDMEEALMEAEQELSSVELKVESLEFAAAQEEAFEGSAEGTAAANSQLSTLNSQLKYQKVRIDEAECADIVSRMRDYIEREKVYTNVDLKMKDLADHLHLSAPKLSQVFNLYLNESYYDFINRYRLDEFKRLIEAGEHRRVTITALSEQCGFKKSSFFSTFRKVEGMTPNEYLKKHGVKV